MVSRFLPADFGFNFLTKKIAFFIFSGLLFVASIGLFVTQGLNYGIDFEGGLLLEVKTDGPANIESMRATLEGLDLGDVALQEFGEPDDVLIRVQRQEGGDDAQQVAVEAIKGALDTVTEYRRVEFVGPTVSEELFIDGVLAVVLAMAAILIYIWFRFEWQFGVGAVIALVHDVAATIGAFAILGLEFNLSTVAAILTIAGYSINDTVVVYDRVRENLRKYKKMPLEELLNMSINQTLSRTIMTSFTTLLAVVALFVLGGPVIHDFSFAMIFGIVVGTYSSICLAVPLLVYLKIDRNRGEGAEATDEAKEEGASA